MEAHEIFFTSSNSSFYFPVAPSVRLHNVLIELVEQDILSVLCLPFFCRQSTLSSNIDYINISLKRKSPTAPTVPYNQR